LKAEVKELGGRTRKRFFRSCEEASELRKERRRTGKCRVRFSVRRKGEWRGKVGE
jgi:hypothetical protein